MKIFTLAAFLCLLAPSARAELSIGDLLNNAGGTTNSTTNKNNDSNDDLYEGINNTLNNTINDVNKGATAAYDRVEDSNYDEVVNNLGSNLDRIYADIDAGGDGQVSGLRDTTLRTGSGSSGTTSGGTTTAKNASGSGTTSSGTSGPSSADMTSADKNGLAACPAKAEAATGDPDNVPFILKCINDFFAQREREAQQNATMMLILLGSL